MLERLHYHKNEIESAFVSRQCKSVSMSSIVTTPTMNPFHHMVVALHQPQLSMSEIGAGTEYRQDMKLNNLTTRTIQASSPLDRTGRHRFQ